MTVKVLTMDLGDDLFSIYPQMFPYPLLLALFVL